MKTYCPPMWTEPDQDLGGVAAFAKVAEELSFRGAAKALGMSKSAVSQKVARLEERLGVRLLERTTRSVRLTDAGVSYYEAIVPALGALRAADDLLSALQERPSGRLRMTAPEDLGQCVIGAVMLHYSERYPDVDLRVDLTNRRVHLVEEGYDLALRAGPLEDSSLIARRVTEPKGKRLYASPEYLARFPAPKRLQDLSEHRLISIAHEGPAPVWKLGGPDGLIVLPIRPHLSVNSLQILQTLVVAGRGIGLLPELSARPLLAEGVLVELLPEHAPPPDGLYAVTPSARRQSASVRAMIEMLAQFLRERCAR